MFSSMILTIIFSLTFAEAPRPIDISEYNKKIEIQSDKFIKAQDDFDKAAVKYKVSNSLVMGAAYIAKLSASEDIAQMAKLVTENNSHFKLDPKVSERLSQLAKGYRPRGVTDQIYNNKAVGAEKFKIILENFNHHPVAINSNAPIQIKAAYNKLLSKINMKNSFFYGGVGAALALGVWLYSEYLTRNQKQEALRKMISDINQLKNEGEAKNKVSGVLVAAPPAGNSLQ